MNKEELIKELKFKAIRSSGAGGQHVNKVSSKIELQFDVINSKALNEEQKEILQESLKNKLSKDGILILKCDESRSQHKNKELSIKRFLELITNGLIIPEKRIATKIPKAVIRKRLKSKRKQSDKKTNRKKPDLD